MTASGSVPEHLLEGDRTVESTEDRRVDRGQASRQRTGESKEDRRVDRGQASRQRTGESKEDRRIDRGQASHECSHTQIYSVDTEKL
jgi:hypothetical protein